MIELKKYRKMKFDWIKFVVISIPTLYVLITYILAYAGIITATYFILIGGQTLVTISGIVFGYIILDSLKPSQV